jgi:hypothetical protein
MLFHPNTCEQSALQRQLDADRLSWSRRVQLEIEGSFTEEQKESFRMHGLFGEIPETKTAPMTLVGMK